METQTQTATTWTIDPTHSEVQFKVKHLMISTVTGLFSQYAGQVEMAGDDFADASITFSADIDSISTGNEQRDGHLKSAEFFDIAQFPKLMFTSTGLTKTGDDTYKLAGDLTMHGVTKPVTLDAVISGPITHPMNKKTVAGFKISGEVKRADFTVGTIPTAIVSDEIIIRGSGELVKN